MKKLQRVLRYVLPLLFGAGIVWIIATRVDLEAVGTVLRRGIAWPWVWLSLGFALASHIVRGLRWRQQIQTLGVRPSAHDMAVSVFGNYGLNLVIPRLGELWRCNYIAQRYAKAAALSPEATPHPADGTDGDAPRGDAHPPFGFSTVIGTMVSERVVDMGMAFAFLVAAVVLERSVFADFFAERAAVDVSGVAEALTSWWLWTGVALVAIGFFAVRRHLREARFFRWLGGLCRNVWAGFVSLRALRHPWLYLAYSIVLWGCYYANTWLQFYFFDFTSHLGASAALAIFVLGSLSLLVPVQGGLGAWHAAVIFGLSCYGIPEAEAFSFALVSWAIEQGFVLLLGLYALLVVMVQRQRAGDE